MDRVVTNSSTRLNLALTIALAIAGIYLGREVLVPIALAILFSFLLGPMVVRLQRYIGRIAAVLFSAFIAFAMLGTIGFFVGRQLTEVASKLPEYRGNIEKKVLAVRGVFGQAIDAVREIHADMSGQPPQTQKQHQQTQPSRTDKAGHAEQEGTPSQKAQTEQPSPRPVPVQSVEAPPTAFQFLQYLLGPLLGPLETTGIVIVFVIFMLIEREGLRDRLLRLVGHNEITVTTQALDEAAQRISRYLLMQLVVNCCYGIGVAIGLTLIGVPNAAIWGALATFMRFIPYIGTWMAASVPLTLSIATTNGWQPLYIFLLFLGMDLIVPTFVEPLLYGSSTGVSALALLISALFWTFLWGLPGLFLSMPLTVCMMVIGRYVPPLRFLDVLLSDRPVLDASERLFQRLLAMNEREAAAVLEDELKHRSLHELFDAVIFPALSMAGNDRRRGRLDERHEEFMRDKLLQMTDGLIQRALLPDSKIQIGGPSSVPVTLPQLKEGVIVCIPARTREDMYAGALAAQYLRSQKIPAEAVSLARLNGNMQEILGSAAVICISALSHAALAHARTMHRRIRERFPNKMLVICLWGSTLSPAATHQRLHCGPQDRLVMSLKDLCDVLSNLAAELPVETDKPLSAPAKQA